jgi:class 3 adenylate cyclase
MTSRRAGASLRFKWTLVILLASVVPMLVAAWASERLERRSLERAEAELQIAVVDELAETFVRSQSGAESGTVEVGRLVSDARLSEDARLLLAQERLGRVPDLDAVGLYDDHGAYLGGIVRSGANEDGIPKPLPPAWTDGSWHLESGELLYVSALVDEGVRHGWVVGKMKHGLLQRETTLLGQARFGNDGSIVVVDRTWNVIAGPASGPIAIGKNLRGRDAFGGIDGDALWNGVATFRTFEGEDGTAMVATTRTIPERGWAIVVRRSEADAFPELATLRRGIALAVGAVGLVAIVVAALLAARTTRPVSELVALTRAYAARRFGEKSPVRTGDELQELGDAMSTMATTLAESEVELRRRTAIEAGLARYLPREVAEKIARGDDELGLAGERRYVAVLFADVASFTTFAEKSSPEDAVKLLNELFALLSEIVFRHGGMVDKFMGDCIMAVFGTRGASDPDAIRRAALDAAEDMHRFVEAAGPEWFARFDFELKLGIGVASGDVLLGNLGGEERVEFTAIGDVVNVASRLESAAQPGQTLCTSDTTIGVTSREFQPMGAQALRGKKQPVEIFRPLA